MILLAAYVLYKEAGQATRKAYDINKCEEATGSTTFYDYSIPNKTLCYEERANQLNDLDACSHLRNKGICVANISLRTGIYYCDEIKNQGGKNNCNEELMLDWKKNNKFHDLEGIEKHRLSKEVKLTTGDTFISNPVTINSDGITFIAHNRFTCLGIQDPPIKANTVGGGPNYIYVTKCSVDNEIGTIEYFKYDFPFLKLKEGV